MLRRNSRGQASSQGGSQAWECCSCSSNFIVMKDTLVKELWNLPIWLRRATEGQAMCFWPCIKAQKEAIEWSCDGEAWIIWRPQDVRVMGYLPRKDAHEGVELAHDRDVCCRHQRGAVVLCSDSQWGRFMCPTQGMGMGVRGEDWSQLSSLTVNVRLQGLQFVLLRFFFGPAFPYSDLSHLNSLYIFFATICWKYIIKRLWI